MIIAQIIKTGEKVAIVGSGFGAFATETPHIIWGNLDPRKNAGTIAVHAICDQNGNIGWIPSDQIKILEIDGVSVQNLDIVNELKIPKLVAKCKRCGRIMEIGKTKCSNCQYENE